MSTKTAAPTATDVRTWATSKGIEVAAHGRLPFDVVERFNKGRKVPYVHTMKQPDALMRIEGLRADSRGVNRKVVYRITPAALRQWGLDNGFALTDRGRIPAEVITAYGTREAAPVKG